MEHVTEPIIEGAFATFHKNRPVLNEDTKKEVKNKYLQKQTKINK